MATTAIEPGGSVRANRSTKRAASSLLSVPEMKSAQKFHVLIAANGERDLAQAEALMVRFSNHPKIETRAVADTITQRMARTAPAWPNIRLDPPACRDAIEREIEQRQINTSLREANEMCEWADILVLAPIDANTMAMMLNGITGNMMLEILRSWDVSKKILMCPGMTNLMWENPMTRKQLFEFRTKWNWIRIMSPILWSYDADSSRGKCFAGWTGFNELVEVIQNQADLMTIGHDVDVTTSGEQRRSIKTDAQLPPEIWSLIFQYVGDWETAVNMRVWTDLPTPDPWKSNPAHIPKDQLQQYLRELEWTILLEPTPRILQKLSQAPRNLIYLSSLSVKLVIKFSLVAVLSYLEANLKDVFWQSFGSKLLPTKASAAYERPQILEWWRTSPSFLKKDYTAEAVDGASKSGFVHVLDWWRKSGLPLKYTDAALEQASSKGHILVLEWWKEASMHQGSYFIDEVAKTKVQTLSSEQSSDTIVTTPAPSTAGALSPLRLKVGKSIIAAAQNGHVNTIRWWDTSGIPYSHSESVARTASAYGHVAVLEEWKALKGDKFAMSFDNQVLVGPTKNGFVRVLEWWKAQSMDDDDKSVAAINGSIAGGMIPGTTKTRIRVEYKTCDIEEALEDSVRSQGGEGEDEVRGWWAKNGLNLGVGTSEWMQVKTL